MQEPALTTIVEEQAAAHWVKRWYDRREGDRYFPATATHLNRRVYDRLLDGFVYDRLLDGFAAITQPAPDDYALEVGCGYGEWMVPLSRLVCSVRGIDLRPQLVAKAQDVFRVHGVHNAETKLCDGQTIPYGDEVFSLVYSIGVFCHVPKVTAHGYLRESWRVLRPGGRTVHQTCGPNGQFVAYTPAEATAVLTTAGFANPQVHDYGDYLLMVGDKPKTQSLS